MGGPCAFPRCLHRCWSLGLWLLLLWLGSSLAVCCGHVFLKGAAAAGLIVSIQHLFHALLQLLQNYIRTPFLAVTASGLDQMSGKHSLQQKSFLLAAGFFSLPRWSQWSRAMICCECPYAITQISSYILFCIYNLRHDSDVQPNIVSRACTYPETL